MATSITPRGRIPLGASMVMEYGDYNTDGSTTLTLNFSGGYCLAPMFFDANQNALDGLSSPAIALSARAVTGSVTSYTLTPSSGAITNGTYVCIHGGS